MLRIIGCLLLALCLANSQSVNLLLQRHGIPPPDAPDSRAVTPSWGSFVQRLDHFNPQDVRTWQMRYLNNSQFFKPGGPLVVFLGGEWTANPAQLMSGQVYEIAQKEGGYMFYPEHRFYGRSVPTKDLSSENLRYLTTEQALEDFAHFLAHQKSLPAFKNSSVIVSGGSYSATLATWMRLKYPHLVDIAYSSSAPLFAVADFYEYLEVVSESLEAVDKTCTATIKQAVEATEQLLKTPAGAATVGKAFKLCDSTQLTKEPHRSHFFSIISGRFSGSVQYASGDALKKVCAELVSGGKTPFDQLAAYVSKAAGSSCVGGYQDYVKHLKNVAITEGMARQWTYQTCTEYGFYQTTSSKKQVFGGGLLLPYHNTMCQEVFGKSVDAAVLHYGVSRVNLLYGSTVPKTSYVLSIHGSVDPWHRLGVLKNLTQTVQTIFVPGASHCQDLKSVSGADPPQLAAAKRQIPAIISKWLKDVRY